MLKEEIFEFLAVFFFSKKKLLKIFAFHVHDDDDFICIQKSMKLACGSILALFTAVYNFLQPLSKFTFVSVHMISVYYREPCFHANETPEKKNKKKKNEISNTKKFSSSSLLHEENGQNGNVRLVLLVKRCNE